MLCFVVAGCASPPSGDVTLAKATIDKAVAAGAENYAAESLAAARQAQAALDAELQTQAGKWRKSYDKARDLAIAVQAAADKAAADAARNRAGALAAATAATTQASSEPNLFQNGDFTEGLRGWAAHPESDATVTVQGTGAERVWHVTYRKGNWGVIQQTLRLRPGTVYIYEVTIKSTAPVVALYWQAETGRFHEIDKAYPEWTRLRYVFETPSWAGQPYPASFHPILMKGAGEAWLKDLRLSEYKTRS